MQNKLAKEPVLAAMLARLVVGWASAKGLELSIDQVLVVVTTIEVVLGWLVRRVVEPTATLKARASQAPPAEQ